MNDSTYDPGSGGRDEIGALLKGLRREAPPGFEGRVMRGLAEEHRVARHRWPQGWGWMVPALAGAAVVALMVCGMPGHRRTVPMEGSIAVQFDLHAPEAGRVELVGDFTGWETDRILLEGPDPSGRWTVHMELPAGRYEYLFLVDGQRWVTDPLAYAHRPDGFGNQNAVMNL